MLRRDSLASGQRAAAGMDEDYDVVDEASDVDADVPAASEATQEEPLPLPPPLPTQNAAEADAPAVVPITIPQVAPGIFKHSAVSAHTRPRSHHARKKGRERVR